MHATVSSVETDAALPEGDDSVAAPSIGGTLAPARFWGWLCGIVAGGLVIRVVYVMTVTRYDNRTLYDSFWYGVTANGLKQGTFFRVPFGTAPSAAHPPLTSLVLGSANFVIGLHAGTTVQRLVMSVVGAAVILFVGLLGRAVAGPWVGLTAAGLAAVAPNFWIPSGIIMSEALAMLLMALILLAVVRMLRAPNLPNAALLGMACGAEALVRAELILFVPALLVPAVLTARLVTLRRRLVLLGASLLVVVLVLAPWVGRNLATFQDRTYLSTGNGLVLLGSNCPAVYSGAGLGLWSLKCADGVGSTGDESVQSAGHAPGHPVRRTPLDTLARRRACPGRSTVGPLSADSGSARRVQRGPAGPGLFGWAECVLLVASAGRGRDRRPSPASDPTVVPAGAGWRTDSRQRPGLRLDPVPRPFRSVPRRAVRSPTRPHG